MTSAYKMPPLPDAIDLDYDSGEGGRGGAIWHTTDDLIAYAAPLGEEIARLQAQVDALAGALACAEAALSDIGDADREPGDDVKWCEQRAAEAIPAVRAALAAVGR